MATDPRLTRIRVEGVGSMQDELRGHLIETAAALRREEGGIWASPENGLEIQTAKRGFWGRYTIVRRRDGP